MRHRFSVPGYNFRIVTLAALAVLALGGSVLGFSTQPHAAAEAGPTTTVVGNSGRNDADLVPQDSGDDTERVSEVSTTLVTSTLASERNPSAAPTALDVVDDRDETLSVSGVPTVVDGGGTEAEAPGIETSAVVETPGEEPVECVPADAEVPVGTAVAEDTMSAPLADAWFFDDFAGGSDAWTPLSGTWTDLDGAFVQTDGDGYDFIAQLPIDLPPAYRVSVDMRAIDGALGGGIVVGQPVLGSRRGATLIDFTDGGSFLRWGVYDPESGQYRYRGGLATGPDFDPAANHRLAVEVRSNRTLVTLDGRAIGDFEPVTAGRTGLAASLSAVAFDNLEIVEL